MPTEKLDYPVHIEPLSQEDGGGFVALVPDLPGCMSDGETPEEALANVRDAIAPGSKRHTLLEGRCHRPRGTMWPQSNYSRLATKRTATASRNTPNAISRRRLGNDGRAGAKGATAVEIGAISTKPISDT